MSRSIASWIAVILLGPCCYLIAPISTTALGVVISTGSGYTDANGSIFLSLSNITLYEVFVGGTDTPTWEDYAFNDAYVEDLDVLHLDEGLSEPNWTSPFTLVQNRVDGFPDENFAESSVAPENSISTSNFDTGVNVDVLPEGAGLWLVYQTVGNVPEIDPISAIPEPGTLALGSLSLLGLAFYGWRRRR